MSSHPDEDPEAKAERRRRFIRGILAIADPVARPWDVFEIDPPPRVLRNNPQVLIDYQRSIDATLRRMLLKTHPDHNPGDADAARATQSE